MIELLKVGDITPIDFMPYRGTQTLKKKGLSFVLKEIAKNKFDAEMAYFHFKKELHIFEIFVLPTESIQLKKLRNERLNAYQVDF